MLSTACAYLLDDYVQLLDTVVLGFAARCPSPPAPEGWDRGTHDQHQCPRQHYTVSVMLTLLTLYLPLVLTRCHTWYLLGALCSIFLLMLGIS